DYQTQSSAFQPPNFMGEFNNHDTSPMINRALNLAFDNPNAPPLNPQAIDDLLAWYHERDTLDLNNRPRRGNADLPPGLALTGTDPGLSVPAAGTLGDVSSDLASQALAIWQAGLGTALGPNIHLEIEHLPGHELADAQVTDFGPDGLPSAGTILIDPDA